MKLISVSKGVEFDFQIGMFSVLDPQSIKNCIEWNCVLLKDFQHFMFLNSATPASNERQGCQESYDI